MAISRLTMVTKTMWGIILFAISIGLQVVSFFTQNGNIPRLSVVGQQGTTSYLDLSFLTPFFLPIGIIIAGIGLVLILKERKYLKKIKF